MRIAGLAIIALLASVEALAQEQPIVRAEITPKTVAVGEPVELTVTVLVPTWFTRPSVYPTFELANAITRLPDDSSYPLRERVGNDSWSGIVRSYEILPLFGATYKLNGQSISISYANPGSDPVIVEVAVPEVIFKGVVPAGAEALNPYIAGSSLKLSLSIEGDMDNLAVGDALVLNYMAELEGLPAIFLPPLSPPLSFEGVSAYADAPDLYEGEPSRRSEKLTLVFDAGGEFVVPDVTLGYWNTEIKSIDSATVEGFAITVAGPLVPTVNSIEADKRQWIFWVLVLAGLSVFAALMYAFGSVATGRYRAAREERKRSEPYAFAALQTALRANDAGDAYRAMLTWLERLDPDMSMRQLAGHYGDETLLTDVEALSRTNYAGQAVPSAADTSALAGSLAVARRRYLSQSQAGAKKGLPPLNP
jgi:hypothetical protein